MDVVYVTDSCKALFILIIGHDTVVIFIMKDVGSEFVFLKHEVHHSLILVLHSIDDSIQFCLGRVDGR